MSALETRRAQSILQAPALQLSVLVCIFSAQRRHADIKAMRLTTLFCTLSSCHSVELVRLKLPDSKLAFASLTLLCDILLYSTLELQKTVGR